MTSAQRDGDAVSCGDTQRASQRRLFVDGLPAVVLGDLSAGHGGFPPTPAIDAQNGRVFVDGRPVVFTGGRYAPHTDGDDVHAVRLAQGVSRLGGGGG